MKDEKTLVDFGKGPKRRMSMYPNVQAKETRACDGQWVHVCVIVV